MGAERMTTGWVGGLAAGDVGYQPRHRSTRQAVVGVGRQPWRTWRDLSRAARRRRARADSVTDASWLTGSARQPDFLDQLTSDEVHRLAEDWALAGGTTNVPELVHDVAHSSHTAATLTSAWREFQQCTREARELRMRTRKWAECYGREYVGQCPDTGAAILKARQADTAWWLITNGLP